MREFAFRWGSNSILSYNLLLNYCHIWFDKLTLQDNFNGFAYTWWLVSLLDESFILSALLNNKGLLNWYLKLENEQIQSIEYIIIDWRLWWCFVALSSKHSSLFPSLLASLRDYIWSLKQRDPWSLRSCFPPPQYF